MTACGPPSVAPSKTTTQAEVERRRLRAAGFDAHLVEPLEPSDLESLLARPGGG